MVSTFGDCTHLLTQEQGVGFGTTAGTMRADRSAHQGSWAKESKTNSKSRIPPEHTEGRRVYGVGYTDQRH